MAETKRINKVQCTAIPLRGEKDARPVKGAELFPEIYANIFLCAKKKSGKTSVIYQILKRCVGRDTSVVAFVSTLNKDAGWDSIRHWCEEKGVPFVGYTSLAEDGVDQLQSLVDHLQADAKEEAPAFSPEVPAAAPTSMLPCMPAPGMGIKIGSPILGEHKGKPLRKTPYQAQEYIIILDDLADQLKKPSIPALLKKNRHLKFKVIVSSQWLNDLHPEARRQMDYIILFKGQSSAKIAEIYKAADLSITLEEFQKIYDDATAKPYSFLYIDTVNGTFRRNFNEEYLVD